jgi:lipopolysaccharide transport system permease protein
MAQETWRFRELVRRLVVRDFRAQYRQSYLGYFWAFVPALAMAAGFTLARNAEVLKIGDTVIAYPAFVMVGTVLWQTFTNAVNGPIEALDAFKPVMSRIYLPPEIIIFCRVGQVLVNLSIQLFLVVVIFIVYKIPVGPAILLAPVMLALLILLGTLIGLILAPISALYTDVQKGLPVAMNLWFLLTPVVYPAPERGVFSFIVKYNPVTPILVAARDLATAGFLPNPGTVLVTSLVTVAGFVVALIAFRISMPYVIERTGA